LKLSYEAELKFNSDQSGEERMYYVNLEGDARIRLISLVQNKKQYRSVALVRIGCLSRI
jgi:hypothetical protein